MELYHTTWWGQNRIDYETCMKILSLAAPSNNSGKTLLATRILEAAPGRWQAAKISTIYSDGNCPRDSDSKVCACTQLHADDYRVITDLGVLGTPDTDTGDLVAAGGDPVLWGLARPGGHQALWEHLGQFLHPERPLVTEGSQIAGLLAGRRRLIYLVNTEIPRRRWKSNAGENIARADLVVVNPYRTCFQGLTEEAGALLAQLGDRGVLCDVGQPAATWPAALRGLIASVADAK